MFVEGASDTYTAKKKEEEEGGGDIVASWFSCLLLF